MSQRENIGQISAVMLKIHKLLLENELEKRERSVGHAIPPVERLQLLLNDPELAWLRAISQLIALVDEVYFQKEAISENQVNEIQEKVQSLFELENDSEFSRLYRDRLRSVPDLMLEHGRLRLALRSSMQ